MVTWALGLSMKKAGMRDPVDVFSQRCREGCRYVGGGGWKSNELMAHTYSHIYAIPTTGLRFFTVYVP